MSLNISPFQGYFTRNTEVMSEMDPYIELTLGSQKHKTAVIEEGGKKVSFPETFTFNPQGNLTMTVKALDQDNATSDEIGTGFVNLSQYFRGGIAAVESVSLKFANKPAGKVLLRIEPTNGQVRQNRIQTNNNKGPIKFFTPEDIMRQLSSQGNYTPQQQANMMPIQPPPMQYHQQVRPGFK